MLEVDKINVFYEEIQVLWDVSLRVEEGKIVALIGSNGAGKSTTINTVTGIMKSKGGRITFCNEEIQNLDPHVIVGRGLCQIPEERLLFSEMTVLENLELGSYTKGARAGKDETLTYIYDLFPVLSKRKEQLAGSLSGGEQQMLAIGRGLMSRPRLLILDEPSFGLAPFLVDQIFEVVASINTNHMTILLVEQNIYQSLDLSHFAYVLENGKIMLQGTGRELLENSYVKEAYLGI